MQISEKGLKALKGYEGCSLTAYRCPAGVWTIGYGHTRGVKPGDVVTEQQAEQFLLDDLAPVYLTIEANVKVPLTQGQLDALCSFIFNCGTGAFVRSTLLKKLNAGDYRGAVGQFMEWNKAGGRVLPGLDARRSSEKTMFLS
ncbi:lysozyme [Photorhabdus sp. HUG-39]|uniref:Lysozyme n=2 Tax=Photorhabdus TaxID=29487 RepID=A0ABX0B6N4_9GAMM|nr:MULTISPECIES: lysozyme [Photorhabdus]MCC8375602.1 lysozyme [Photorhabdus bodei]MDB6374488.1 lysozyme [Photorhabdus bodei]NDL14316.1 glycoside hydrolase family protein [Photorhabdus kayaii]NDL27805.1 glycoside hydrolase family protein [Photorhabdus kayaii]RAX06680.1 lysozyme [Photorhabdus sp. HUG-39]